MCVMPSTSLISMSASSAERRIPSLKTLPSTKSIAVRACVSSPGDSASDVAAMTRGDCWNWQRDSSTGPDQIRSRIGASDCAGPANGFAMRSSCHSLRAATISSSAIRTVGVVSVICGNFLILSIKNAMSVLTAYLNFLARKSNRPGGIDLERHQELGSRSNPVSDQRWRKSNAWATVTCVRFARRY
jgi:hypothetical protein